MRSILCTALALTALAWLGGPSYADSPRHGHRHWAPGDHGRFHDDLRHREFHRRLEHREAHRYPMNWWQHERLHDHLDHDRFHDRLEHRQYHRDRYYIQPYPYYAPPARHYYGPPAGYWYGY